jgi:mevalonate kinase
MAKCKDPVFAQNITGTLKPTVNALIDDFLAANWLDVETKMQLVSQFQLEHFLEMIPPGLRPLWQDGLNSGDYALKLCGAGGGGFLMGIARDQTVIETLNKAFPCSRIW